MDDNEKLESLSIAEQSESAGFLERRDVVMAEIEQFELEDSYEGCGYCGSISCHGGCQLAYI